MSIGSPMILKPVPHDEKYFLSKLLKEGKRLLTDSEMKELLQLTYPNGSKVFTLAQPTAIYELANILMHHSVAEFKELVSNSENFFQLMKDSPRLKEDRKKVAMKAAAMQIEPTVMKGVGKCPNCGSEQLTVTLAQLLRADEGQTGLYRCLACKHKWKSG